MTKSILCSRAAPKLLFLTALLAPSAVTLAAELRGTVVDDAGKPVRGAMVRVDMGAQIVTRLSGSDGSVVIPNLQPGEHEITVRAFGYAHQPQYADPSKASTLKLVVTPHWDVTKLTTAEYMSGVPDNAETRYLRAACMGCHNWYPIYQTQGMKADGWMRLLSSMGTTVALTLSHQPDRTRRYMAHLLEKYFGPDAPDPQRDQVKHVPFADEALKATVYEWELPEYTKFSHSIAADNKGGAWFTGYDPDSNYMARIDYASGELRVYPLDVPFAGPHTPIVDKRGRVWTPLADGNGLNMIDPATDENKNFMLPLKEWGFKGERFSLHTPALDRKEETLWFSAMSSNLLASFSMATQEWAEKPPLVYVPDSIPPNTQRAWLTIPPDFQVPGAPAASSGPTTITAPASSYHVEVDSKGMVWYTQLSIGTLVKYDPKTGKSENFTVPGVISTRGMVIDADDNIWYSNWDGGGLAKLDQKKGNKVTLYKSPSGFGAPYGIVMDKKGNIWFADYSGDNMTRFNPKTEQFVDYPIPTNGSMPRFISVDNEGRVWFTEWWQSRVGVLLPEGGPAPAPALRAVVVESPSVQGAATSEPRKHPVASAPGEMPSASIRHERVHGEHTALVQSQR